ncbi:DMT family transporter [Defluviimonas salinarum]|uniref:DMT family transporter n=1 Tax=Defluviimonas salinarum TaxID=2992147 RepID=A0ABT3J2I3_9RHOB|nr:DMT family transporter [Defluviimonas salinarum]MCW3781873.1 DMT family transporter [Defluviimonas salinarum]
MADAVHGAGAMPGAEGPGVAVLALLVAVGSLIATAVALSKLAAAAGAPMLGYLAAVWLGAGLILAVPVTLRRGVSGLGRLVPYGFGAGGLMALPSAMGYLSVVHVGAGYISLTFAFPALFTWLIARGLRMQAVRPGQGVGVLAGLAGGMLLASGKLAGSGGPDGGAVWVALASAIPVALALGNIFRSRYWPAGEAPLTLAALSVLLGAALVVPAAAFSEGNALARLWQEPFLLLLTLAGALTVAAQYLLQFRLQQTAGPVYMSQIGTVAAVAGALIAVLALAESLPAFFWPAATMIAAGTVVFHRAAGRSRA